MPYTPTDWVDEVTLVDAAKMDKIEAGLVAAEEKALKGVASGYASLDATGKVPVAQLPVIPAIVKLAEVVLASPAATIDFSSIPATYAHLELILSVRSDRAASSTDPIRCRFNNDSGSVYDSHSIFGNATTTSVTKGEIIAGANIDCGIMTAAAVSVDYFGVYRITLPNYRTTNNRKALVSHGHLPNPGASGLYEYIGGGSWRTSNAAINRITFLSGSASNFIAGSSISLYGVN